jgi:adenylate cyclase class IV
VRNIEIKAVVPDLETIRVKASALAGGSPQVHEQHDTFFVVPRGRLKVRAFPDGLGELIAYERANQHGPKLSTYSRVPCRDARELAETLARVLPVRGVVAKHREVFLAGRARIHLDRVDGLGSFVELEVVLRDDESPEAGYAEARQLLAALDIPDSALLPSAYIDLFDNSRTATTS